MLKQKSRIEWINMGDTNSRFYHSRIKWRLMNNGLNELYIEGE